MGYPLQYLWASLVAQLVKNPPTMWETWVRSLGWEDPLEEGKATHSSILGLFLVAQLVKYPPAMQETWVQSLGWEDPLEKEKATHSSILAWRIPWTELGWQRVRHDWATFTSLVLRCWKPRGTIPALPPIRAKWPWLHPQPRDLRLQVSVWMMGRLGWPASKGLHGNGAILHIPGAPAENGQWSFLESFYGSQNCTGLVIDSLPRGYHLPTDTRDIAQAVFLWLCLRGENIP